MAVDIILGLQWGDEGKGKIVDFLAPDYHLICRFQGGPNAGHTLKFGGAKHVLHTVPSGIFRQGIVNLIGNGVVIDPVTLAKELAAIIEVGIDPFERLLVARKAHLILPTHRLLDLASEQFKGTGKIGSTLRGIGPTYMDKTGRNGLRVGDLEASDFKRRYQALKEKHLHLLQIYPGFEYQIEKEEATWFEALNVLRRMTKVDGEFYVNEALIAGKRVLAEGAQGSMLDIDFGTYPFVTSSNTVSAGACTGLGISPRQIGEVIGITKAYCTRVGSGPFPTELHDDDGARLASVGMEFGATTGRPRRCGWLDLVQLKYTVMLNGVTQMVMTKMDVLDSFPYLKVGETYRTGEDKQTNQMPFDLCAESIQPIFKSFDGWEQSLHDIRAYSDLPDQARSYIEYLERALQVPFTMISTGPERERLILRS